MRKLLTVALAGAMLLVGCGGDSEEAEDIPAPGAGVNTTAGAHDHSGGAVDASCNPSGTAVTVTARDTKFSSSCLAAPANQAFTIALDNRDALPHNIAILQSHSATSTMARLEIFQGPGTQTLNVSALPPGQYAFHCEVHPAQMSGVFVVK